MKTVWITGGSRGIGRACALRFAADGDRIALLYRADDDAAREVAEACRALGAEALPVRCDVADRAAVFAAADEIRRRLGPIDVLINNAGIAQQKLFTDISEADWRRMMGVNLDGVFFCCQAALPDMIHRKSGRIINVSSMWGQVGASCEVHYSAAKAAVNGLTQALAKELGPSGITVNAVAPGVIDTEMNGLLDGETRAALADETPLERLGTPDEVARVIHFLAGPGGNFITGQVIGVNGGFVI